MAELFDKRLLEIQLDYIHCLSFTRLAADCFQKWQ